MIDRSYLESGKAEGVGHSAPSNGRTPFLASAQLSTQ